MATTKLIYTGGEDVVCHALASEGLPTLVTAGRELRVSAGLAERLQASSPFFAEEKPKAKKGQKPEGAADEADEDTTDQESDDA